MMFEQITGLFSAIDSEGITVSLPNVSTDAFKGWWCVVIITGIYTEFEIKSNSKTKISFTNSLSGTGSFIINFVTRQLLEEFESDVASVGKVPDALIDKKVEVARKHLSEKIKSQFKYLFSDYPEDESPLARVINLNDIQVAFIYYALFEIYSDLSLEEGDNCNYKSQKYLSRYKDIIKESLSLLSVDTDSDGAISNVETARASNISNILVR